MHRSDRRGGGGGRLLFIAGCWLGGLACNPSDEIVATLRRSTRSLDAPDGSEGAGGANGQKDARESLRDGQQLSPTDAGDDRGVPLSLRDDFPESPLVTSDFPPGGFNAFLAPNARASGPCLQEPPIGALIPSNWPPPAFEWTADETLNMFELSLHMASQRNTLVLYTTQHRFTLPEDLWRTIARGPDREIAIQIRGASLSTDADAGVAGPVLGTSGSMQIAPVGAFGELTFFTVATGIVGHAGWASTLSRISVGGDRAETLIAPPLADGTTCVGCHAVSPDGHSLFFSRSDPSGPLSVDARTADGRAPLGWPTTQALNLLARPNQSYPSFSVAHFTEQERLIFTSLQDPVTHQWEIAWTDLMSVAPSSGTFARRGDPRGAATPAVSPDGATLAYASTSNIVDGHPMSGDSDIFVVPFGARGGGFAKPLHGADSAEFAEHAPAFSPAGELIAFTRSPTSGAYAAAGSEIFVVRRAGGDPLRLAANDPASCNAPRAEGVDNSWSSWSSVAPVDNGDRYLWLAFSSKRRGGNAQIFVAGIVITHDDSGVQLIKNYPALYLPAQPKDGSNYLATWTVQQELPPTR